jgi:hypothetical protein
VRLRAVCAAYSRRARDGHHERTGAHACGRGGGAGRGWPWPDGASGRWTSRPRRRVLLGSSPSCSARALLCRRLPLQVLGNSAIRISWGRSSSRAANQAAAQQLGAAAAFPGLPGAFPGFDPGFAAAAAAQGYQLSAMAGMGPGGGLPGADHYAAVFAAQPQAQHNPEDLYQARFPAGSLARARLRAAGCCSADPLS